MALAYMFCKLYIGLHVVSCVCYSFESTIYLALQVLLRNQGQLS